METGKAIYKLLKDSAAVGAICADRIYPELAQQDADMPFIVYTVTDTTPSATKNATSKLDTARVELYCVSDDYETGMNLGIAVRGALDRVSGTVSDVEVQSIDFDTSDIQYDPDQRVYVLEQSYDVRIQRTGTAQVVSQFPGNTFTVEEVDGEPSGAVNKLVFSNGTVTIDGRTATIESGAGGGTLIVREDDGGNSAETSILQFPKDSVSHDAGTATIDAIQMLVSAIGDDTNVTGAYFANGLVGDFDQDGYVGAADLIIFLGWFSYSLDDIQTAVDRASAQSSAGNSPLFSNSQYSKAAATKTALEAAGHTVEYFEGINVALGGGYVADWEADTVADYTVRRTLYISNTSFPTSLAQFQAYPLGPYDDSAKSLVQTVVNAFMQGSTGNVSIVVIRTLISASPNLLLDTYTGAAVAYSVRKLDKDYSGYCMKVRRDSDDAEADIGFDGFGGVDQVSIATHCGAANGYVVTWYDQSGNSNDATQSTAGSQPQIYNGTAVITENGKPALDFDGTNDFLSNSSPTGFSGKSQSAFNVSLNEAKASGIGFFWAIGDASPSAGTVRSLSDEPYLRFQGTIQDYDSHYSANTQRLYSLVCPGTVTTIDDYDLYRDGSLLTPDSSSGGTINNISADFLRIGVSSNAQLSLCINGKSQEFIFYNADQSSNRTGIESDINTYFSIYT